MLITRFSGLRLIMSFGIILILCAWLFVWRQINFEYNMEIERASREGMNLCRVYEEYVRSILQAADQDLLALRAAYQREGFSGQAFHTLVNRMREDDSRSQIGVSNAQGIFQSFLIEAAPPTNVADREYFAALRETHSDAMYIGKSLLGRQSGQATIPLGRRLTRPDGTFDGIVIVSIKTDYFVNSFKSMDLGTQKTISIIGRDGFVRANLAVDNNTPSMAVSQGDVFRSSLLKPFGTVRMTSIRDDVKRIYNYRVLPEYSVYVSVGMAEEDVLQAFIKRRQGYIGAAAVITIIILVSCGILIRRNLTQRALESRIKEDAVRLRALQETTSRLLIGSDGVDGLLQMILLDALQLVDAPRGLIGMVDLNENKVTVRYGIGLDAQRIGVQQSISEGLMGEVISRGEQVYVADYSCYPGRLSESLLSTLKSILGIPLKIGDNVIGVLAVQWDHVNPEPQEEVLQTLRQYAHLAAIALERAHIHYEIQQLAYTDTLTGLPNRRSIYTRLGEEINKTAGTGSCGAVLFIDLDNLKLVNDTLGHNYGDNLLVEASRHITRVAGEHSFVGRLAGDEFVVIKPNCGHRQDIASLARTLIKGLDQQYDWEGSMLCTSASIGVAIFPQDGATVEEILKNADAALYAAKHNGKNSWQFYDATLQQSMLDKMLLTSSLYHALERGEMCLYYQPVMNSQGGLVGFEALLRWKSPQHGFVPPAQFIPIAEQSGQIRPIGAWVLQEACRFARRLADLGYGSLSVEVNVSARQLEDDDFIDIVTEAINAAAIKPDQIGLEITESVFMESIKDNAVKLNKLQSSGIKVALDDFGEGYSSLTKLLQLPVDALKISRTLIGMLGTDQQQSRFITSIVGMAHALGLSVVAEGVETEQQLFQVTASGCDRVQGYFYYRPMPQEDALRLVPVK